MNIPTVSSISLTTPFGCANVGRSKGLRNSPIPGSAAPLLVIKRQVRQRLHGRTAQQKHGWYPWIRHQDWLVVWNINFIFPYIGNNHPNWHIFQRGSNHQPEEFCEFLYRSGWFFMRIRSEFLAMLPGNKQFFVVRGPAVSSFGPCAATFVLSHLIRPNIGPLHQNFGPEMEELHNQTFMVSWQKLKQLVSCKIL